MSRFADPTAVDTIDLGPCGCPGTPHERDEVVARWDLSASALARVGRAQLDRGTDFYAPHRALIVEAVVSWNLLTLYEDKPVPVPVVAATVAELDEPTLEALSSAIDDLISSKGAVPNDSGAPSPASPRGSASHPRKTTPKHGT